MGKKKFVSQTDLKIAVIGDEVGSKSNLFFGNNRIPWRDSVWRALGLGTGWGTPTF